MQNVRLLVEEVLELERRVRNVEIEVFSSKERWNPVAAVSLRGLPMPRAIVPTRAELRVPIPDLYGYACSADIAVFSRLVHERLGSELRPVPFASQLTAAALAIHERYYVDIREHSEILLDQFAVCVSPVGLSTFFVHLPLHLFVRELLRYLESPNQSAVDELSELLRSDANPGVDVNRSLRIAHLLEGLGRHDEAVARLEAATATAPGDDRLRRKLIEMEMLSP